VERISHFCLHEHNHRNYRTALKSAKPPTLPYMAIYTADLTHVEDGNEDRTATGLINFEKMRMISSVWRDIARFQSLRFAYCFRPIAEVQTWFNDTPLLTTRNCTNSHSSPSRAPPATRRCSTRDRAPAR
jgi:hypothetical protein